MNDDERRLVERLEKILAAHLDVVATRIIDQALGDGAPDAIEG